MRRREGTTTNIRSVMDRARLANRRSRFRNNDYDYYNRREDRVEDYTGHEPFMYNHYEDEVREVSRFPYGGRMEDEYLERSDYDNYSVRRPDYRDLEERNYSKRHEEYGDIDERNYSGQNEAGFLYHIEPRRRRNRDHERDSERRRRNNPEHRDRNNYREGRERREHEYARNEERPLFNTERDRRSGREWWKGRRQY